MAIWGVLLYGLVSYYNISYLFFLQGLTGVYFVDGGPLAAYATEISQEEPGNYYIN